MTKICDVKLLAPIYISIKTTFCWVVMTWVQHLVFYWYPSKCI